MSISDTLKSYRDYKKGIVNQAYIDYLNSENIPLEPNTRNDVFRDTFYDLIVEYSSDPTNYGKFLAFLEKKGLNPAIVDKIVYYADYLGSTYFGENPVPFIPLSRPNRSPTPNLSPPPSNPPTLPPKSPNLSPPPSNPPTLPPKQPRQAVPPRQVLPPRSPLPSLQLPPPLTASRDDFSPFPLPLSNSPWQPAPLGSNSPWYPEPLGTPINSTPRAPAPLGPLINSTPASSYNPLMPGLQRSPISASALNNMPPMPQPILTRSTAKGGKRKRKSKKLRRTTLLRRH